jgi:DNA-nicking Smr family endonuclease
MKNNRGGDPDDLEIWRRVAETVRPYHPSRAMKREKEKAVKSCAPAPAAAAPPKPLIPERAAPAAAGFDAATGRRLKRGQLRVEGKIDLHGLGQQRAFEVLSRFISAARAEGRRNLLVVTGKGLRGGGVLRRMLPLWLSEGALGAQVLACTPARPKDGGEGAFYVRLRKPES